MMIQIINDDCLNALKNMPDNAVDYVITSPPYNIGRSRVTKSGQKAKYEHFTDKNPNYFNWSLEIIDELLRVTNKHIFYNIQANWTNKRDVYKLIGNYSDKLIQNFIWTKQNPPPASEHYAITNSVEYILGLSNEKRIKGNKINSSNHIHTTQRAERIKGHNAVMNKEIANYFVNNFTQENETILDPFMGSGTTGISCVENNRNFIGIELSSEYCETAEKRINEAIN
jgi:site-specific DNA-methyltransferase (adenine-specific)